MDEIKNMNEQQMGELVKINHRLNNAQQPDIDAEWKAFCDKKFGEEKYGDIKEEPSPTIIRRPLWHLYVSALVGAAATLLVIFLLRHQLFPEPTKELEDGMMAMVYDDSPQRVSLQTGSKKVIDISQQDSISFFSAANQQKTFPSLGFGGVRMQKLSTPRGMDYKVILADGTEVWLNAESRIEFPSNFQGNERRVKLLGEAYFKVARNEKSPFVVSTEQMDVRVLGTEFNLKSYSSETAHITLVKGSLEVYSPGSVNDGVANDESSTLLKPGQDAWYDKDGKIQVAEIDVYDVIQWKDGFFYFNDKSLVTVLRELGRWYNLGVIFRNANAMNHKVHFSALREGNIQEALTGLNSLRKVKISLQGNNIVVE